MEKVSISVYYQRYVCMMGCIRPGLCTNLYLCYTRNCFNIARSLRLNVCYSEIRKKASQDTIGLRRKINEILVKIGFFCLFFALESLMEIRVLQARLLDEVWCNETRWGLNCT